MRRKSRANFSSPLRFPSAMTMKEGNDGPTVREGRREPGSLQLARRITRRCLPLSLFLAVSSHRAVQPRGNNGEYLIEITVERATRGTCGAALSPPARPLPVSPAPFPLPLFLARPVRGTTRKHNGDDKQIGACERERGPSSSPCRRPCPRASRRRTHPPKSAIWLEEGDCLCLLPFPFRASLLDSALPIVLPDMRRRRHTSCLNYSSLASQPTR